MGFSYGYNRNEPLSNYRTGLELVWMFVDTVSRGGNLLLNIGPRADGRIPEVMQERLKEMGDWLPSTAKPSTAPAPGRARAQWTAGKHAGARLRRVPRELRHPRSWRASSRSDGRPSSRCSSPRSPTPSTRSRQAGPERRSR